MRFVQLYINSHIWDTHTNIAADLKPARGCPLGTEQGKEKVALPLARQATHTEDLASPQLERDAPEPTAAQVVDPQPGLFDRDRGDVGVGALETAAAHEGDRLRLRDAGPGGHVGAVAEHGDPIGQRLDLAPPV